MSPIGNFLRPEDSKTEFKLILVVKIGLERHIWFQKDHWDQGYVLSTNMSPIGNFLQPEDSKTEFKLILLVKIEACLVPN